MKQLYALLLLTLFLAGSLQAEGPHRGYIVTKNGKRLTGYIGEVLNFQYESMVVFINDFGSVYNIEAERIRGFAFRDENGYKAFESKRLRGRWSFLQIVLKGRGINLYQSPEKKHFLVVENGALRVGSRKLSEYWVEIRGRRRPMRITPRNFRRKMRRLFKKEQPKIWQKVDDGSYTYKELEKVAAEYNRLLSSPKYDI